MPAEPIDVPDGGVMEAFLVVDSDGNEVLVTEMKREVIEGPYYSWDSLQHRTFSPGLLMGKTIDGKWVVIAEEGDTSNAC